MNSGLIITVCAAALNGLLAGATLDQSIKQLPARQRLGLAAFSRYAQAADLKNGVPFYAFLGIGGALMTIAAAIVAFTTNALGVNRTALLIAALFSVLHFFTTTQAAPLYFSQKKTQNEEELRTIFDAFERWNTARAVFVTLTFIATLVALTG